jgi:methylated-DNA-[protein]-cysteine S-methyltransferase
MIYQARHCEPPQAAWQSQHIVIMRLLRRPNGLLAMTADKRMEGSEMTPQHAMVWLKGNERSIESDAVTQSLDALYAAGPNAQSIARAQAKLRQVLAKEQQNVIYYDLLTNTSVGTLFAAVSERGLVAVDFGFSESAFVDRVQRKTRSVLVRSPREVKPALKQLKDYLIGKRKTFDLPIDYSVLSEFQKKVLLTTLKIPRGQVLTYGDVARKIGRPRAARAVGQALGSNPMPIVIPCHRVLGSDGSLHGYSGGGGIKTKAWLLKLEGATVQ